MLLFPFKKLRFGKWLGLFLPVGEERAAGRGGDAAPDVMLYSVGLARARPPFCSAGPRVAPPGCGGWFVQNTGPGGPRDGGDWYARLG